MEGFFTLQCPERGPALTHAHSFHCVSEHTPIHFSDQCCHCEMRASDQASAEKTAAERRSATPHLYKFTMTGRCLECQKTESEHLLELPEPVAGCTVDHRSITSHLLIGDGGAEWTKCPMCGVHVEPAIPETPGLTYKRPYGPGRLPFITRHWEALEKVHALWVAGYFKS